MKGVADADSVGFASINNVGVANNDILIARGEIMTGKSAQRDIAVAVCVREGTLTDGCVAGAGGIENERVTTNSCIAETSCVAKECPKTVGCVEVARRITLKRKGAYCSVVAAAVVIKKRVGANGRVI